MFFGGSASTLAVTEALDRLYEGWYHSFEVVIDGWYHRTGCRRAVARQQGWGKQPWCSRVWLSLSWADLIYSRGILKSLLESNTVLNDKNYKTATVIKVKSCKNDSAAQLSKCLSRFISKEKPIKCYRNSASCHKFVAVEEIGKVTEANFYLWQFVVLCAYILHGSFKEFVEWHT